MNFFVINLLSIIEFKIFSLSLNYEEKKRRQVYRIKVFPTLILKPIIYTQVQHRDLKKGQQKVQI